MALPELATVRRCVTITPAPVICVKSSPSSADVLYAPAASARFSIPVSSAAHFRVVRLLDKNREPVFGIRIDISETYNAPVAPRNTHWNRLWFAYDPDVKRRDVSPT